MGVYEIWGQNDEENLSHGDNYSIVEDLNVEAESAAAAVQSMLSGLFSAALEGGDPLKEVLPPPANGDHWHFKVVDAFDHTKVEEFAVRFRVVPMLEMSPLTPAGEDASA